MSSGVEYLRSRLVGGLVVSIFVLGACSDARQPSAPDAEAAYEVRLASERVPGISVALRADRTTLAPGETIHFTAVARNSTSTRVQIGVQCGPAMDVIVSTGRGQLRSVVLDNIGKDGAFTCELGPQHFVEANSTHEMLIGWTAPTIRGEYAASGGLRRSNGVGNLSTPVTVTVR